MKLKRKYFLNEIFSCCHIKPFCLKQYRTGLKGKKMKRDRVAKALVSLKSFLTKKMLPVSRALVVGLALVTLEASSDFPSYNCRRKLGQIICSTYYHDHLMDCYQGLNEHSFVRKGSEFCLEPVPEYCVSAKLCDNDEIPSTDQEPKPSTAKPQASPL